MSNTDGLEAVTKLLIARVGGPEAAGRCCRVGKTQLARHYDRTSGACMPVDVVMDLEKVASQPMVKLTPDDHCCAAPRGLRSCG
jgi:hypothetical protein